MPRLSPGTRTARTKPFPASEIGRVFHVVTARKKSDAGLKFSGPAWETTWRNPGVRTSAVWASAVAVEQVADPPTRIGMRKIKCRPCHGIIVAVNGEREE